MRDRFPMERRWAAATFAAAGRTRPAATSTATDARQWRRNERLVAVRRQRRRGALFRSLNKKGMGSVGYMPHQQDRLQ